MALRRQMIDFIRAHIVNHVEQRFTHRYIAVMQIQFDVFSIGMGVVIQMIHPPGIEGAGPSDNSVNFITF